MNTLLSSHIESLKTNLRANWKSGLTVSLVSIPLSVSLAVASQSTPTAGIVTAIWAGFISSLFAGSHFNIIGPTGALSGILATYAIAHGAAALPTLALVTGFFVLLAYVLRLERYLVFVPASTIHGFTLGVAFIIGLGQANFALGLSGLPTHERFIDNLLETVRHLGAASPVTILVFLVFLALLFVFLKATPKLPGAIILAPVGILIGYLSQSGIYPLGIQTLGGKFSDVAGTLFIPHSFVWDFSLVAAGFTVALVAILETMISAKIADGMTGTKHEKRKEMFALGLANIGSGLMGGIPATAALARTSLNVKTGATNRISGTVNGISIAVISLLLLTYFSYIPLAVIAAILVFVAIRMVEHEHFVRFLHYDRKGFFIALVVAFVTIYYDPIGGILLGTAISLIIFMEKLSRGQFELVVNDKEKRMVQRIVSEGKDTTHEDSDTLVYSIKGQLAYINAQSHIARFEKDLNGYENIILRLRELYFIDIDGIDALSEIIDLIHKQGKKVLITGANPLVVAMLKECRLFRQLENEGSVFDRTRDALVSIGYKHL